MNEICEKALFYAYRDCAWCIHIRLVPKVQETISFITKQPTAALDAGYRNAYAKKASAISVMFYVKSELFFVS
jgi:hypothetical protein